MSTTPGTSLADLPLPILLRSLCTTAAVTGRNSPSTAMFVRAVERKFRRRRKAAPRKGAGDAR
jgi:hypothetical protein